MSADGRYIDARLGTLSGEGSLQIVRTEDIPGEKTVFRQNPSTQSDTYYERPVLKKSVWTWDIPVYYYVGGATGASMALGAAATLLNRDGLPLLVRNSRWIGVIGAAVSTGLLIHDLGRPSRFLYMLRVFRPTSPMSVGSWILVSFSSFAGLSAVTQFAPRPLRWVGDCAAVVAGVLGLGLSGYTGVLVAHTVVPIWQKPARLLPVLFLASAAASAASLFDILGGSPREHRAVTVFGTVGKVAEIAMANALERDVASVPEVVKPLQDGLTGLLWQTGKFLSASSLALSLMPGSNPKMRRITGVLGTLGAICIRFGIHYAGQRSAMNPRATFHQHRAGQGAFEVTGQAAVTR